MFSHLIVDVASVILAASGLGALGGGVWSTARYGRALEADGYAGRAIREGGYLGGAVGALSLFADLLASLY